MSRPMPTRTSQKLRAPSDEIPSAQNQAEIFAQKSDCRTIMPTATAAAAAAAAACSVARNRRDTMLLRRRGRERGRGRGVTTQESPEQGSGIFMSTCIAVCSIAVAADRTDITDMGAAIRPISMSS